MTAIIESRPRIPRLAMVFIAAVVVLLLTAPKAFAWSETVGDFKIEKPYSSYGSSEVTVKEYTGNGRDITLPSTVTYKDTEYTITAVGSNVLEKFAGVDGIDLTVTIPEGYTTIKGEAFKNCYGLKSITIPGSVTNINYNAFDGCKDLAAVTFADGSADLSFGNKVFLNCTSLNNLTLPARLSDAGYGSFQGCTALTNLTVDSSSTALVVQDGSLYEKNSDGVSYTMNTYSPTSTATSFTVPETVNSLPLTGIGRMTFQNNAYLSSVTVPANVVMFDSSCFDGCSALKKVSIAAENPTIANYAFTNLAAGSVIEVANDSVVSKFTSSTYTSSKTTIQVKSAEPETEATPAASLTVKGAGVKDGYSYYTVKLDSAANVSTMIINLSFDASQVSQDAQVTGKPAAYTKVKDKRFTLTPKWKEEGVKVKVSLMLTTDNKAVTSEEASDLLLLALPVKTGVTGNIAMTVDSATCGGVVSGTTTGGTVSVNGSTASNRVTSYDVYADSKIDILDITEAQRFYQATSTGSDWATAQKADVNGDDKVDIQDLIDIFLQIEF